MCAAPVARRDLLGDAMLDRRLACHVDEGVAVRDVARGSRFIEPRSSGIEVAIAYLSEECDDLNVNPSREHALDLGQVSCRTFQNNCTCAAESRGVSENQP
jgi:hypothetical protein